MTMRARLYRQVVFSVHGKRELVRYKPFIGVRLRVVVAAEILFFKGCE